MLRQQFRQVGLALSLGTLGGWLLTFLNVPLPWLLGSLCATIVASIAGLPVEVRSSLRKYLIIALGVMVGGTFSPDILTHFVNWVPTLGAVIVYLVLVTFIGSYYCRYVLKMDNVTALFSAMPGGMSEMVTLGEQWQADTRSLTLTHMVRIATVLISIPFFLTFWVGLNGQVLPTSVQIWDGTDVTILVAAAVAGYLAAKFLRLPAPALLGPLILSAAIHMSGLITNDRPVEVAIILQVALGGALGSRFFGVSIAAVGRLIVLSIGMAIVMMAVTILVSFIMSAATGISFEALVLALSPGGFAEMSLAALSMNLDPAFVTTHHIWRIMLIVFVVPVVMSRMEKRNQNKMN